MYINFLLKESIIFLLSSKLKFLVLRLNDFSQLAHSVQDKLHDVDV